LARTPPVLHESGERLGRRFVSLLARSVGAASEIGELVDVAVLRRPADGVVDQRDVLCPIDAMRLNEIACECRVVFVSLTLVAALGRSVIPWRRLRLRWCDVLHGRLDLARFYVHIHRRGVRHRGNLRLIEPPEAAYGEGHTPLRLRFA